MLGAPFVSLDVKSGWPICNGRKIRQCAVFKEEPAFLAQDIGVVIVLHVDDANGCVVAVDCGVLRRATAMAPVNVLTRMSLATIGTVECAA